MSSPAISQRRRKGLDRLRTLDVVNVKTSEEILDKSPVGAIVTIVGLVIMFILFYSEAMYYFRPVTTDTLFVDITRDQIMKVQISLSMLSLKCSEIALDTVDDAGEPMLDATKNIVKRALKDGLIADGNMVSKLKLFGGPKLEQIPGAGEGCFITGHLELKKVKGNFHIAAGRSGTQTHMSHSHHIHQLSSEDLLGKFNISHIVHHLSFGDSFPGQVNPLDGAKSIVTGPSQVSYLIQVVPTIYEKANGKRIDGNQISVTEHHKVVDFNAHHFPLPGLFFKYDISPFVVKYTEQQRTLSHFLTRACAITGGTFVVLGMVYTGIKRVVQLTRKYRSVGATLGEAHYTTAGGLSGSPTRF